MNLLYANDQPGEFPASWYAATATPPRPFPELKGETRADVCVVGAGYTGLSTALHLAQAGVDVALVEAHRVGFGASGRNGGQVGSGQRKDQGELERAYGIDDARKLWAVSEDAKALVKSLIAEHGIDAAWRIGIAHADWTAKGARESRDYAEKLRQDYGYTAAEPLDRDGISALVGSDVYHGGMMDWGAGHIHPLRFAFGLAQAAADAGVRIFELSEVHDLRGGVVRAGQGRVAAEHVVMACNGYHGRLDPKVAARVMPINNFVVATEPLGDRTAEVLAKDIAVADSKFVINYWRLSEDRRLLFGGGESYGDRFPRDIAKTVRKPMLQVYPHLADVRIDYAWGGTLGITPSRMPDFARPAPGLWSASGYSGHGVALATYAGKLMSDAIRGDAAGFDLMARVRPAAFPGLGLMRAPLLALAMSWYALRDRLGV
ncbi:MAG: FAD-binding oxidoreductase [Rhodobacteraceae bacterium]|nr:FAD-binding oxidoreductase [Paracoccaceae bacterium]